ncbi:potassium channel family protein [Candidatus Alkanophaga liquidiphilum]|nr:MAG: potassium channel protein [Candidatus Alkanophagales archaeon]
MVCWMLRRVKISILILSLVLLVGCVGFHIIEKVDFLTSAYWTVATVTTVGYGDITPQTRAGMIFALLLMTFGVGAILYALTTFIEMMVEGHLREMMRMGMREREIKKMHGHIIVCGYDRIGRKVVEEFRARGERVVIIDKREEAFRGIYEPDVPFIVGDARKEEILERAGVKRAKGLITTLHEESDNLLVVLNAKDLNPNIRIVSRADDEEGRKHLLKAGAERVILPEALCGVRMARAILHPGVCDFIDLSFAGEDVVIEEFEVSERSKVASSTIRESKIREKTGAMVVALKRGGTLLTNPSPDTKILAGDVLIVIIGKDEIKAIKDLLGA